MRILIASHAFLPSLGGIETTTDAVARELVRRGHDVCVVTETPGDDPGSGPYAVERRPSAVHLVRRVAWSEVCLHNNISLRAAWPLLLIRRPWVVVHQTFLRRPGGSLSLADRVKRHALARGRSIAVSQAVARDLPVEARVIPNPYRDDLFRITNRGERTYDLAFLGRLVSDKGAGLLLDALERLRGEGLAPRLLLIGGGPEDAALRARVAGSALADRVAFAGPQCGDPLVSLLNSTRILVVPSLWPEPFGIVALEGIACGCAVIGSAGGGLPEAIGPCGLTFPNGDAAALSACIGRLLRDPPALAAFAAAAPAHLARHSVRAITDAWLEAMTAAVDRSAR